MGVQDFQDFFRDRRLAIAGRRSFADLFQKPTVYRKLMPRPGASSPQLMPR